MKHTILVLLFSFITMAQEKNKRLEIEKWKGSVLDINTMSRQQLLYTRQYIKDNSKIYKTKYIIYNFRSLGLKNESFTILVEHYKLEKKIIIHASSNNIFAYKDDGKQFEISYKEADYRAPYEILGNRGVVVGKRWAKDLSISFKDKTHRYVHLHQGAFSHPNSLCKQQINGDYDFIFLDYDYNIIEE